MNREDIVRMAQEAGVTAERVRDLINFANLVASAERERIKQANAPEIERINAHIKELEDAVIAEREACADLCKEMYLSGDMDTGLAEEAIRARGDGITLTNIRHPRGKPALGDLNPESLETVEIDLPDQKPIAWYDPTNGMVSTDKDSPLFTPLGQVWPLYPQSEQEPVAWFSTLPDGKLSIKIVGKPTDGNWEPLYTTPPQRTWIGLTDEEMQSIAFESADALSAVFVAEAKLKEKNNG